MQVCRDSWDTGPGVRELTDEQGEKRGYKWLHRTEVISITNMCFRNSEEEHGIVQGRKHRAYNNANWITLKSQHWGVKTSRKEEVIWSVSQDFASSEMKGDTKVEGTWMVKDQQAKGRGYGWISSSCLIGNLRMMGGHQWQGLEWEVRLQTGDWKDTIAVAQCRTEWRSTR